MPWGPYPPKHGINRNVQERGILPVRPEKGFGVMEVEGEELSDGEADGGETTLELTSRLNDMEPNARVKQFDV